MISVKCNKQNLQAFWQKKAQFWLASVVCASGIYLTHSAPVMAQAAYGSYIGGGVAVGVNGRVSGNVGFRYKFLRAPLSVRTQVLIGDTLAVVPTVSYDFPLGWQANAYIGLGASVPLSGSARTPVGNRTALAIQPGIDYAIPNSPIVVFGNSIIAIDGYRNGGTAASFQFGAGFRY